MRCENDLTLSPPIEFAATASLRQSRLERMPTWLICIPLVLQWIVLAVRYRSITLPSATNSAITSGGLVGEGKLEYFRDMGPLARAATARHCAVSTASLPSSATLLQCMDSAGLSFPVIVKPNLGLCGYGVRLIADMEALHTYLAAFPAHEDVVLQQYLPAAGEAGIFYVRDPATDQGRIIGLALRYFPRVTGDGEHTVAQLIANDARARRLVRAPHHECAVDDTRVPMSGEVVRLATIGSTRIGGLYRNGAACITPQLTAAIDAIARDMPTFYCGRFDVRFNRQQDLSAGTGFTIMEVNGAGSEAIHAWDPAIGVVEGFRMIFAKQRTLFAIGDTRRRSGVQPIGLLALVQLWRRQRRLIALYRRLIEVTAMLLDTRNFSDLSQLSGLPQVKSPPCFSTDDRQFEVYWADCEDDVRDAQRLRYQVFAQEMGARLTPPAGTAAGLDVDRFDAYCDHVLVRLATLSGAAPGMLVGTYRVLAPCAARRAGGFYTDTEFDLAPLNLLRAHAVELGRSCVHADWRSGGVIMALWTALGQYMQTYRLKTMIGCASVQMDDGGQTADRLWQRLRHTHLVEQKWQVLPYHGLVLSTDLTSTESLPATTQYANAPALIKGYLRCGARLLGSPAVDVAFNTADLPLMLRVNDLAPRYRTHFLGY